MNAPAAFRTAKFIQLMRVGFRKPSHMGPIGVRTLSIKSGEDATPTGDASKTSNDSSVWNWVPPRQEQESAIEGFPDSASKKGIPLEIDEVVSALKKQGGEDITVMDLATKLVNISSFIIVTGKSERHLRKMKENITREMKLRGLRRSHGAKTSVEISGDDWLISDCYSFIVHLMLPATRKHLDLETHWTSKHRPHATLQGTDKKAMMQYEKDLDALYEMYPCPSEYMNQNLEPKTVRDQGNVSVAPDESFFDLTPSGLK